ncbi:CpsD/CapB family tyrosine-protein kinase [Vibrio pectenicida]|uniref:Chromosome partitioning protein ParA n=1 Tax=Vibrio pectenicida TaxID=62763 RepID=A0A3R9G128_9VIBR|nr:CpsD/CapB family tyrosine-protein kinase [Vibrio pectenicida]RSD29806.1 chromosome partitioning protein ParA [Vibrio pectenicida]
MTIPATLTEVEQIYLAAEFSEARSLCITGCNSGDGVTSVASAIAERYLLGGHKTLLVDLNLFHPAFEPVLNDNDLEGDVGVLLEHKSSHQLFTGMPVPKTTSTLLAYKDPAVLSSTVDQWLQHYDRVICDTSPLLHINRGNIPAQVVASACDQTVLVVMGGKTSTGQIEKSQEMLDNPKISFLGSVLNLKNQATLGQEMARELNRLKFLPKSWREKWCRWLITNEFLAHSA